MRSALAGLAALRVSVWGCVGQAVLFVAACVGAVKGTHKGCPYGWCARVGGYRILRVILRPASTVKTEGLSKSGRLAAQKVLTQSLFLKGRQSMVTGLRAPEALLPAGPVAVIAGLIWQAAQRSGAGHGLLIVY